jgi:hypothetical protein
MKHPFPLTRVGDGELLRQNEAIWQQRRRSTAQGLAHLAEIDARRLFLPAAYDSMQSFCIHELRFTADEAEKHITAARVAQQYPVIFRMIAAGQLHITGVLILAPRLTPDNAEELLAQAADQTLRELRELLARRFPRPDLETKEPPSGDQLDLAASAAPAPERVLEIIPDESVDGRTPAARGTLIPLSADRFGVRFNLSRNARDHYEYARDLLSHELPRADLATVTELALVALVEKLEKRKFCVTRRTRSGGRSSVDPRYIPAPVRRAVHARDGGRCTFTSEAGKRCPATRFLEFDHVNEVARGGAATVDQLRIRCRAHNHYTAEITFGKGFMDHKRRQARERAAQARARKRPAASTSSPAPERVEARVSDNGVPPPAHTESTANRHPGAPAPDDRDVTPWLRGLGVRADEARRMAEICQRTMPDASLEERLKRALAYLAQR